MRNKWFYATLGLIVMCALMFFIGMKIGNSMVVKGDINGDGQVTITDYTMIRLDILGLKDID